MGDSNNWSICLNLCLKFIDTLSSFVYNTINIIKDCDDDDDDENDNQDIYVTVDDLKNAEKEYMDGMNDFVSQMKELSNYFSFEMKKKERFNSSKAQNQTKHLYKKKEVKPSISLNKDEIHSKWNQLHNILKNLSSFNQQKDIQSDSEIEEKKDSQEEEVENEDEGDNEEYDDNEVDDNVD